MQSYLKIKGKSINFCEYLSIRNKSLTNDYWKNELNNKGENDRRNMGQGKNPFKSIKSRDSNEFGSLHSLSMLWSDRIKVVDSFGLAYKIVWKIWVRILFMV